MPVGNFDPKRLSDALTARVHRELERSFGVPPALPDGTVTVLFTDVQGSTDLVRALGDRDARTVLRRHDAIVREALAASGGAEVEHPGDGFMVAFRTASAAVACAIDVHRRLADERGTRPETPLVRIGMDTGEVISEDAGYFGATVFRAARITALAAGGESIVSHTVRLLAEPADVEFVDLGEHELKGLAGRHRLFRLEGKGTSGSEPPAP